MDTGLIRYMMILLANTCKDDTLIDKHQNNMLRFHAENASDEKLRELFFGEEDEAKIHG